MYIKEYDDSKYQRRPSWFIEVLKPRIRDGPKCIACGGGKTRDAAYAKLHANVQERLDYEKRTLRAVEKSWDKAKKEEADAKN